MCTETVKYAVCNHTRKEILPKCRYMREDGCLEPVYSLLFGPACKVPCSKPLEGATVKRIEAWCTQRCFETYKHFDHTKFNGLTPGEYFLMKHTTTIQSCGTNIDSEKAKHEEGNQRRLRATREVDEAMEAAKAQRREREETEREAEAAKALEETARALAQEEEEEEARALEKLEAANQRFSNPLPKRKRDGWRRQRKTDRTIMGPEAVHKARPSEMKDLSGMELSMAVRKMYREPRFDGDHRPSPDAESDQFGTEKNERKKKTERPPPSRLPREATAGVWRDIRI